MYEKQLSRLAERKLLRHLPLLQSATGPLVMINGKPTILMASNDYLGLATHPTVKEAAIEATKRYGVGTGASRLISGTQPPHKELETALAQFKGTEAALVFTSGYAANVGVIAALIGTGGLILADRLCHASLIDGCRLSGADFRVFRHCDVAQLNMLLAKRARGRHTLIVTDGIFSMDGDAAPLPDLITLAERYHAHLLVDDAHGTGVLGREGRGTLEHFGVESYCPFQMGTLSKALGTSGAYIAASSRTRTAYETVDQPQLFLRWAARARVQSGRQYQSDHSGIDWKSSKGSRDGESSPAAWCLRSGNPSSHRSSRNQPYPYDRYFRAYPRTARHSTRRLSPSRA
jgi:8-amino-7-oxononanoate synthase